MTRRTIAFDWDRWSHQYEELEHLLNIDPYSTEDPEEAETIQDDLESLLDLVATGRDDDPAAIAAAEDALVLLNKLNIIAQ